MDPKTEPRQLLSWRDYHRLASIVERLDLGCKSDLMRVLIFGSSIVCKIIFRTVKDRPNVSPRYSILIQAFTFRDMTKALKPI